MVFFFLCVFFLCFVFFLFCFFCFFCFFVVGLFVCLVVFVWFFPTLAKNMEFLGWLKITLTKVKTKKMLCALCSSHSVAFNCISTVRQTFVTMIDTVALQTQKSGAFVWHYPKTYDAADFIHTVIRIVYITIGTHQVLFVKFLRFSKSQFKKY